MTTYRQAGVDLEAADRHVSSIAPLVTATWGSRVVGGFGGFAAGIELPGGLRRPVLMLTTDGVGTKLDLARRTQRWEGVGFDLVAMCLDDLAAAGASPLGMVDYLAVGKLEEARDASIVGSVARACAEADCPLVGGETAEHPGVMPPDQVDLAGAAVGVVEHGREISGRGVRAGHVVIGLWSPNLRSNGFSLVRRAVEGLDLERPWSEEDRSPAGEVLLRPSLLYAPAVLEAASLGLVHGAAHVTGGGIPGNLVRTLPEGARAVVDASSWQVPEVFLRLRRLADASWDTMWQTFNMGVGFCLIVEPSSVDEVLEAVERRGRRAGVIGKVVEGERGVEILGR